MLTIILYLIIISNVEQILCTQYGTIYQAIIEIDSQFSKQQLPNNIQDDLYIYNMRPFGQTTSGNIFLAQYNQSSFISHNELIILSSKVSYKNKIGGSWISHNYVDSHDAIEKAYKKWGLNKTFAIFNKTVNDDKSQTISIYQLDQQQIINITLPFFPLTGLSFQSHQHFFSNNQKGQLQVFQQDCTCQVHPIILNKTKIQVPPGSPIEQIYNSSIILQEVLMTDVKLETLYPEIIKQY